MRRRLVKLAATLAALAALAVGGSTIAAAAQSGHTNAPPPPVAQTQQAGENDPADATQQPDVVEPDNGTGGEQAGEAADPAGQDSSDPAKQDTPDPAQTAACTAAGIDPSASNVEYDDQTGTCTLDTSPDGGN